MAVYNKIFNAEDWTLVNQNNKDIADDFILEYKQRKMKPTTIAQYYNDLRIVLIYILKQCDNRSILELNKRDFRNFSLYLSDDLKQSPARCNRMMSCLRSLLTFVEDSDDYDYDINYAKKVKGLPKEICREIFFLSDDTILETKRQLINIKEYQKATLLMLLYDSTARKNEIAQVQKYSFIDVAKNSTNKVVGKRGKIFQLLYFDGTKECAKLWLEQRGEDGIDSLFIVGDGDKIREASADTIYNWIISLRGLIANISGKVADINVHTFRHSSIENYNTGDHYVCKLLGMEGGLPAETIQKLARHSSIETTLGYMKDRTDDVLESTFGIII